MKIEIVEDQWVVIDGISGVEIYPGEHFTIKEAIDEYGYSGIMSIEIQNGYGARYSASGYLDCTEWIGPYNTEDAARNALIEMYEEEQ